MATIGIKMHFQLALNKSEVWNTQVEMLLGRSRIWCHRFHQPLACSQLQMSRRKPSICRLMMIDPEQSFHKLPLLFSKVDSICRNKFILQACADPLSKCVIDKSTTTQPRKYRRLRQFLKRNLWINLSICSSRTPPLKTITSILTSNKYNNYEITS